MNPARRWRAGAALAGAASVGLVVAAVAGTLSTGTPARGPHGARHGGAGLHWTPPRTVDATPPYGPSNHLTALACPTATTCVAGDAGGRVLVTSDPTGAASSWTAVEVDPGGSITALACPTATTCVAGDAGGRVLVTSDPTGAASSW
nr:hypothetical protein [Actinomycetota bacterium]